MQVEREGRIGFETDFLKDMNTFILQQFQTPIVIINNRYEIKFVNQAYLHESGFSTKELLGKNINEYILGYNSFMGMRKSDIFIKKKNAERIVKSMELNHFEDENHDQYTVIILSAFQKCGVDPLTMLPNRYYFYQYLQKAIDNAKSNGTLVALLYIDLDRFKFINDTLGHSYGDLLLEETSNRLKGCTGKMNVVARMGGDEFIYLIQNIKEESDVDFQIEQILRVFSKPFLLKDLEIFVSPSIGVSMYPYDGDEVEALIANADTAMYRAKKNGQDKVEKAKTDISAGFFEKLMIENELRNALEKEEFLLYFQPQIELGQERITGMEALIRWNHPVLGIVPPSDFIPIAEETGLIVLIGDWVIKEACLKVKEWMMAGKEVPISVNLSARQFLQNNLVTKIQSMIEELAIPPNLLELEITESMIMYNIDSAIETLKSLKQLGIQIAIDDFGKGYSTLSYLQNFPLDTLKIDQSFIREIGSNPSCKALTKAISDLGHALNLKVIAEGVETKDQLQHVETIKCDVVQGYYFSMPLANNEADHFLLNFKGGA